MLGRPSFAFCPRVGSRRMAAPRRQGITKNQGNGASRARAARNTQRDLEPGRRVPIDGWKTSWLPCINWGLAPLGIGVALVEEPCCWRPASAGWFISIDGRALCSQNPAMMEGQLIRLGLRCHDCDPGEVFGLRNRFA